MTGPGTTVPQIYTIPPGVPFADILAAGLLDRFGDERLALSDVLVLLPNRRAVGALTDAFLRATHGRPTLLPRLQPIGDTDESELVVQWPMHDLEALDIPPAIDATRRRFLLARQVVEWQTRDTTGGEPDWSNALALAAELEALLDQMQIAGIKFNALKKLVPDTFAVHWQKTLKFLEILTKHWPLILKAEGCIDAVERRNRLLDLRARLWSTSPPTHPVIAAGSTGSIPATARLLKVIAHMPGGAIVLPGLDQAMDEASWTAIGGDTPGESSETSHPQFLMKRLLAVIGAARSDVGAWQVKGQTPMPGKAVLARLAFVSEGMRPAATLEGWRDLKLNERQVGRGLAKIECPGANEEAQVIGLAMRETLNQPDKTAILITPDRALARRVSAELARWEIEVDDSAGQPLSKCVAAVFLRLIAEAAASGFQPVQLLAVLKHPLARFGQTRKPHLDLARRLELALLRGPRPGDGLAGLRRADRDQAYGAILKPLAALEKLFGRNRPKLSELIDGHIAAAELLASDGEQPGAAALWRGEAGKALALAIGEFRDQTEIVGRMPPQAYAALLARVFEGRVVRSTYSAHPRLAILGPLEARLQSADLVIIGGMNEGVWPPDPGPDPWLSRPMRAELGLMSRERRVGQAAHDFVQAVGADEVLITRSLKSGGAPTLESRWLTRLAAIGLPMGGGRRPWLALQNVLDKPDYVAPVSPPAPNPPVATRPRSISVTGIESLMRDPYEFYAAKILRLRRLDDIDEEPGARDRGILLHDVLAEILEDGPAADRAGALAAWLEIGKQTFDKLGVRLSVRTLWWPRFERIASAFQQQQLTLGANRNAVGLEVKGVIAVQTKFGDYEITARADRIDREEAGLVIIDYKTGAPPKKKVVEAGFAPQLALEAAIAQAGGFDGIRGCPVVGLEYWEVSGREPALKRHLVAKDDKALELTERTFARATSLIAYFSGPDSTYLSSPFRNIQGYGDYDHLARVLEWSHAPDQGSDR